MEEKPPHPHRKRPFMEDDDSEKPPLQKRVRFPKGKKVKPGDETVNRVQAESGPSDLKDARLAAKERAKHRNQITAELFSEENRGILNDVSAAEVKYEDNEDFVEDGIQIEPFNLDKEREEGYFDAQGNYVEYVNDDEIKDAWLDSVEVDPKYAGVINNEHNDEDDAQELSSEDIGLIKRRITDLLEPGETVLQALRRLKGTSNNRKEKMPAETERVFNQLTEDAIKLLENGEYNVYHEKQEVFKREAEGYEKLARAKGKGTSVSDGHSNFDSNVRTEIPGLVSSALSDSTVGTSNPNVSAAEISSNDADEFDMFADDDEHSTAKPSSDGSNLVSGLNSNALSQPLPDALDKKSETGSLQNDYMYDEYSGYYYSSSLGYYYDPSTGLYCLAASGQWYSFNEETGTYEEIQEVASTVN